ncbi:MAG: acyl CoA:acetate/3-ketoacid CoA transferase [Clostridium sp.]|nr:acyl CoA:acetate/3-ketoacid CoA transferase [Clostridium sp.]
MGKIISKERAAELVKDGDVVGINGFAFGFGFPEGLAKALDQRFEEEQAPRNLTLMFASGNGDGGRSDFGLDHFAKEGMVKRVIAGHVGLAKKLSGMIKDNKVEAYNFPQGVVTHMFREMAGGRKGVATHVGLETFADPRVEGGKMNASASEDLVKVVEIAGEEKLYYEAPPLSVALIRGTTADEFGNLTVEHEGVLLETMHMASAAKNAGGIVIAQVSNIARRGSLDPRLVAVPGILVDYIVKVPAQEHKMNALVQHEPSFTGEVKVPTDQVQRIPMDAKKIIAKRCAMELRKNTSVNLGIGVPEGVAAIALEEGIHDWMTMTVEAGAVGGIPASGFGLGAAVNVESIIGQPNLFDIYDGGGLDTAFLGLAQADAEGNINVSKFQGRMVGCGGFVNITQNTKKVIFCGTFTAGKSEIAIEDGRLSIVRDGDFIKFIKQVEQITFSGNYAKKHGKEVLYVTERAVFRLTKEGMELTEIAPGADLERDILDKMDFKPVISKDLKLMDSRIFKDEAMGLAADNIE